MVCLCRTSVTMRVKHKLAKTVLVFATVVSFILIYQTNKTHDYVVDVFLPNKDIVEEFHQMEFLVNTSSCKIPKLLPYDSSISQLLKTGRKVVCRKFLPLTYENGTRLYINKFAAQDRFGFCKYQAVIRPAYVADHNFYRYGPESEEFTTDIEILDDFIRVRCFNTQNGLVYTNFHSFINRKRLVELKCKRLFRKHLKKSKNKDKLSVLMVGVDSVSRLNFLRYMKKTKTFLSDTMDAIDLMGYNKVADNTFVNIVPMTMGQFLEEVPWNETLSDLPFDKYDFIWKKFSRRGYRTLYAEDQPKIAIFDYLKAGFHQAPGDYFNRHFALAMDKESGLWYNSEKCFGNRLETEVHLNYVQQFAVTFKNRPYFAFSFITGLTHDLLESAAGADEPYLNFLQNLINSNSLNNTVLLLFSDHGLRFGEFRNTYIGRMEERLPFIFLVFPKWFREKYSIIDKNLKLNANRLTTPFDVYETLKDILNFKGKSSSRIYPENQRGISLLDEIPVNRTCDDAGILPHWCTCIQHINLPLNSSDVRILAANILLKINSYLQRYRNICQHLNLDSILAAQKFVSSDKILRFISSKNDVIDRHVTYGQKAKAYVDYQLTIRTRPGGGIFEATMRHNEMEDSFEMKSDISRINLYGTQSHCIDNHRLKKYCYCHSQ